MTKVKAMPMCAVTEFGPHEAATTRSKYCGHHRKQREARCHVYRQEVYKFRRANPGAPLPPALADPDRWLAENLTYTDQENTYTTLNAEDRRRGREILARNGKGFDALTRLSKKKYNEPADVSRAVQQALEEHKQLRDFIEEFLKDPW